MTILNVWVERERALMAVDTEIVMPWGQRHQCAKMIPLIHLNAMIAARGHLVFFAYLFKALHCEALSDFDALLDRMPRMLPLADEDARKAVRQLGVTDTGFLDNQTIVACGWSAKAGRMFAREWSQDDLARGFISEHVEPFFVSPWDPSIDHIPDPTTHAAMAVLAQAQCKLMREKAPDAAAGGKLIVAEINQRGMQIWRGVGYN